MSIRLGSRRLWLGLLVVATLTIGAGVAFGSIPDSGGVIHACYKGNGDMRLIDNASAAVQVERDGDRLEPARHRRARWAGRPSGTCRARRARGAEGRHGR